MLEVFLRSYQSPVNGQRFLSSAVPETALPFAKWKMSDVREVLSHGIPAEHANAKLMYDGDHWQSGWGWAGPMVPFDHPNYALLWGEIMKMFCSRNIIRELVETHVNGVLGRPMRWSLVPIRSTKDERDDTPDALKSLIAEASTIVRQWLAQRKVHDVMRAYLTELLMPAGRSTLRLFLPRGAGTPIAQGSRVLRMQTGTDFGETMGAIFLEKPDVTLSRVYTDPDTQRDIGVSLFRARRPDNGSFQDAASLTFLDAEGKNTVIGTIYDDGSQSGVSYDMGGRLAMFQSTRTPLITPQLLQQNRILNYAESVIPRNLTTAGFLERVIISAQLNGQWVKDEATGVEKFEMDDDAVPAFGPGEVTVLQPQTFEDEATGKIVVTTPSMQRFEPILPTGSIDSSNHLYQNMQREAGQGHLIKDEMTDATLVRYGLSLVQSAIPVTQAFVWVIETALAETEALRGEQGKYTSQLRAQASAFLNVGSITPEQRNALTATIEKSILSKETGQELMGVEDVDEENDRIASQPGAAIDLAIRMANSYKMLRDAGMPARLAAIHSGYSEEDADEIAAEQEKEDQKKMQQQQDQLKLQASLAPKPVVGQRGTAGLTAQRRGRPSGTAERNPGQGQDKGARALQDKKRNRARP